MINLTMFSKLLNPSKTTAIRGEKRKMNRNQTEISKAYIPRLGLVLLRLVCIENFPHNNNTHLVPFSRCSNLRSGSELIR